jgi:hypothetical protein
MNRSDGGSIRSKSTDLMAIIGPDSRQTAEPVDLFVFVDSWGACSEPSNVRFPEREQVHD